MKLLLQKSISVAEISIPKALEILEIDNMAIAELRTQMYNNTFIERTISHDVSSFFTLFFWFSRSCRQLEFILCVYAFHERNCARNWVMKSSAVIPCDGDL